MRKERRRKRGRGEENRVSGFSSQESGRRETVRCWTKGFGPSFKTASEEPRRLDSPGLPGLNAFPQGRRVCVYVCVFLHIRKVACVRIVLFFSSCVYAQYSRQALSWFWVKCVCVCVLIFDALECVCLQAGLVHACLFYCARIRSSVNMRVCVAPAALPFVSVCLHI